MICAAAAFGQKQPFDVLTMLRLNRISEPVLSPDGSTVAFTVQTVDLDKNTKPKQIYTVGVNGGLPRQMTRDGTDNERPRWSPDSRQIYFISNRDGSSQIWRMDADGVECPADQPALDRGRRDPGFDRREEDRLSIQRLSGMRRRRCLQ